MQQHFEDNTFLGRTIFGQLPDINRQNSKSETVPNVLNIQVLVFKNTGAVTVTNFVGSVDGQTLKLLGDGNTTIKNNSTIKTSTGADKLLAVNKFYTFTIIDDVWVEDG